MIKPILFSVAMFASVNSFAAPNQIDVIGLVPDVSTSTDVAQAKKGQYGTFVIGGSELICVPDYIDDKLSDLYCQLSSITRVKPLSNHQLYEILKTGFTSKFGAPTSTNSTPVTNLMGATLQKKTVGWKDKKGNELTITNIDSRLDKGSLILKSVAQKAKEKAEAEETNKSVKF